MISGLLRAVGQNIVYSIGNMASYYGLIKGAGFQRRGRESAQTAADTVCSNGEVVLSSNQSVAYRNLLPSLQTIARAQVEIQCI